MAVPGRRSLEDTRPVLLAEGTVDLAGFRSELWQLPDDPLLGFVEIPAGSFRIGSDSVIDRQAYENERWSESARQGSLVLPSYFIGRFETTVAQYRAFVADTGRASLPTALAGAPDHPVTNISWADALAYCHWLQARLQENPSTPDRLRGLLASGWQITLPSEAQWEKAARGTDGNIYPWGMQLLEGRANFNSGAVRPVGSDNCPECAYGLSDMAGNVWELTRSPLQPYPYSDDDDHDDLAGDALFVMRGGSYGDGPANIRAAVRGGVDPGVRSDTIGFRLVLSPP
jgi:formylglycine-generating enzyme required for sulfatase activity